MPRHQELRKLPYTAEQVFDLIMDIEKYPEFLPWCLAVRMNKKEADYLNADMLIGYQLFRERFRSHVHFIRPNEIEVIYEQGPMKYLKNKWKITDTDTGCVVDFFVDFELNSPLLSRLMHAFFDKAIIKMVEAFQARAEVLYGGNILANNINKNA